MSKQLAIIHTTPLTINSLKLIVNEVLPECTLSNFLDDTILPQLISNGGHIEEVEERWTQYAKYAEQTGADCILSACSSVGELADKLNGKISVPVLRIDEAMAEKAVEMGSNIGIVATLATTLNPTVALIQRKAKKINKKVKLHTVLEDKAFQLLKQGDKEGHNQRLMASFEQLVNDVDVVVLAQASMAQVVSNLPKQYHHKFLSSPRLGIERLKEYLK